MNKRWFLLNLSCSTGHQLKTIMYIEQSSINKVKHAFKVSSCRNSRLIRRDPYGAFRKNCLEL